MWKKILLVGIGLLGWPARVVASVDITTRVQAEYTLSVADPPKVSIDYTLINANPTVYVSQYKLIIPDQGSVSGLVFQPKNETATKEEQTADGQRILELTFDNDVVGQGKRREFAVEYTNPSLWRQRGGSRLVTIDPLPGSQDFDSYQSIVRLPVAWGTPDSLSPEPLKTGTGSGQLVYTFDQRGDQPVVIGYGRQQVLEFGLDQTLANQSNSPAYQDIIFPGDTSDTTLVYTSLYPEPTRWWPTSEGDWRAVYLVPIGGQINVHADGYIIYDRIDQDFHWENLPPEAAGQLNIYDWGGGAVADIVPEASAAVSVQLAHHGFWPVLDRYQFEVHNQTGATWTDWRLELTGETAGLEITPASSDLQLVPWQKTVIIASIRARHWWQPYTRFQLRAKVIDGQGNIIYDKPVVGLSLSYRALAVVGALGGLAAVAGSLLVAGRTKKRHLRRQSQEPAQSA